MGIVTLARIALLAMGGIAAVLAWRGRPGPNLGDLLLPAAALVGLAALFLLCLNHLPFPLHLDLMEGTIWQHAQRMAAGQPVYPAPAPEFVPLAYNPLYYVLAVPFLRLLGDGLPTLRFVALLATVGIGAVLFLAMRQRTGSAWHGLIAVGLFASAYNVMENYVDNAHSDSWFVFTALLGSYVIALGRSRGWNLLGVAVLCASFWFKQHGAVFVVGGVLYLTWREGPARALPYWVLAALLGPALYVFAGPPLFGPFFHYFTWEVPRRWSRLDASNFERLGLLILTAYPTLALLSLFEMGRALAKARERLSVWHVQFVFALLSAFMGTLDHDSANNVFIPLGVWLILIGVMGMHRLGQRGQGRYARPAALAAAFVAFAALVYDPHELWVRPDAQAQYDDLVAYLRSLDGPVYAPGIGYLGRDYALYPAAHWVSLEDIARGDPPPPNGPQYVEAALQPAIAPNGPAYILDNGELIYLPTLKPLYTHYVLERDFGDRFRALASLPKRFAHGWPRHLYRYETAAQNDTQHAVQRDQIGQP